MWPNLITFMSLGAAKKYWGPVKTFIKARPILTAVIIIAVTAGGGWYYQSKNKSPESDFAVVSRGTVLQVVSVTGTVKPAEEVSLSFEKSGRVAAVYREVGARVEAGSYLVALSSADVSAELLEAKATLKAEEAKLEELKKGTRPEDINVSRVAVDNAKNNVVNDLKNGYVNSDDAIRNKVDQLMSSPRGATPQFNYVLTDSQLKTDIESGRASMETILVSWNNSLAGLSAGQDLTRSIGDGKTNLRAVQTYLDKVALAVNSLTSSATLSQTTIDGYKAAIIAGRSNVTSALDTLTSSEEKLKNAESALALKLAGTVPEQVAAQEAKVEGAAASVKNIEAQLAKTVIYSPIAGIVTRQDVKVGELAPAATPLVTVISEANFQIEANVPEADISKIKVGDLAQVTLDAYGSDVFFAAVVTQIDPAEIVIDGVATYKTTLQFRQNDARIRSGMTANTDIYGEKRENALYLPGRAISTKGGTKTAQLLEGKTTREITVTTGLRGSSGDVEILSGLEEGDRVKIKQSYSL